MATTAETIDDMHRRARVEADWDRAEDWWAQLHQGRVLELGPLGWEARR